MRVLNLSGPSQPLAVEIDVGPAYELLLSLVALSAPAPCPTFEIGEERFAAFRSGLSAELAATVGQFVGHDGAAPIWGQLLGLASTTPAPRDIPAFLTLVEATDPIELRLHLLGYYSQSAHEREAMLDAARGEVAALDRLVAPLYPDQPAAQEAVRRLFADRPDGTRRVVVQLLARWYDEVFCPQEELLLPVLARDAEAKRALARSLSPERLIEAATNGIEYVPEPGIRRVVLIPNFVFRPWNLLTEHGDAKLICYPVADESLEEDPDAPPARLVKLYRALGDERRLRTLRKLAAGSSTLQELADAVGVKKSTMHHHLGILRAAGLVRVKSGEDMRYSLRHDLLPDVAALLESYLGVKRET